MSELTHLNKKGEAIMVDVSGKEKTVRVAVAEGFIKMKKETLNKIMEQNIPKGDVLSVARIAGIMAVKKTPELIPLCHPLLIDAVTIDFEKKGDDILYIQCTVKTTEKTGVEMEALTGVSIACLTVYDMCKAVQKDIEIGPIRLIKKTGGKSGTFVKEDKDYESR
ncbi:MAG: cyclic pyranopterin monophosphate synthase MoaC [Proteobacteria bacterium]|nr:cyclic pyranopterin monophosphate synthase MoaC [Pseudomonadota bacterium]